MATRGVDKLALEETEELSEDEFDFEKEKDRFVQNETDNTDATELRSLIWKTFTAYAGAFLEEAWKVAEGQKEENVDESLANESTHAMQRNLRRELKTEMKALATTLREESEYSDESSDTSSEDSYSSFSDFEEDLQRDEKGQKSRGSMITPSSLPTYLLKKQNSLINGMSQLKPPKKIDRHLVRRIFSQNRRRYVDKANGYDLDLVYITPKLIAMAHPSSGFEMIYRNNYTSVMKFLSAKHGDHYRIYNLCMKRKYKLTGRVVQYGFLDHNPCPLPKLCALMKDIDTWLKADERNVAGIHCKAGKGRTGMTIACYLIHCGMMEFADEAIKYFGEKRTTNGKGITIPSQKRYVEYYERAFKTPGLYRRISAASEMSPRLLLTSVTMYPIPSFLHGTINHIICKVGAGRRNGLENLVRTRSGEFRIGKFVDSRGNSQKALQWEGVKHKELTKTKSFSSFLEGDVNGHLAEGPILVQGDFRFGIYVFQKRRVKMKPKRILNCWLNTNYLKLSTDDDEDDDEIMAWEIAPKILSDQEGRFTCKISLGKYKLDGLPRKDTKCKQVKFHNITEAIKRIFKFPDEFVLQLRFQVDKEQPSWTNRKN